MYDRVFVTQILRTLEIFHLKMFKFLSVTLLDFGLSFRAVEEYLCKSSTCLANDGIPTDPKYRNEVFMPQKFS